MYAIDATISRDRPGYNGMVYEEHSSKPSSACLKTTSFPLYRSEPLFHAARSARSAPKPRSEDATATPAPPLRAIRGSLPYSYSHLNAAAPLSLILLALPTHTNTHTYYQHYD